MHCHAMLNCVPVLGHSLSCRFAFPALKPPAPFTLEQPVAGLTSAFGPQLAAKVCLLAVWLPYYYRTPSAKQLQRSSSSVDES